MIFGRSSGGLKRSTPSKTAHRMGAAHHLGLSGKPKGAADLSSFLPPRNDQGSSDTCFSHSLSAAIFVALAFLGRALGWVPSMLEIASTTYADVRSLAHPSGALPPLQDDGAELQDVATAAARWGVCPMGPTVNGRFSDVPDPTGYGFPEPSVASLMAAAAHVIGGEYTIPIDTDAPSTIALALDAGIPVWVGGLVGQAYQDAATDSVQEPTPASDKTAGGHAQLIVAYRTNAAGEYEFLVVNSWGPDWALNGTVWVSSAWVLALWEAWPMAVKS